MNRYLRFIPFILAAIFVLTGCSSTRSLGHRAVSGNEYYNDVYRGATHAQIIEEYGAPDRETSDGKDGYILVYETFYSTSYVDGMGFVDHSTRKSYIQFFMDKRGVCYNVMTNKPSPEQTESALTAFAVGSGVYTGLGLLTLGFLAFFPWMY